MNKENTHQEKQGDLQKAAKLPYEKPALLMLGKVTNLTMGSVPGNGESGNQLLFSPRQNN